MSSDETGSLDAAVSCLLFSEFSPGSGKMTLPTTFMAWNLMHLTRMQKDQPGIPVHGNQRSEWDAGCRFDFPNPEYR